jgi:hypothetical protein
MQTETHETRLQVLIDALESNEYQQTIGALRKGDHFCVAGVACDVYYRATGDGDWGATIADGIYSFKTKHSRANFVDMPPEVQEYFRFSNADLNLLMESNDFLKLSFTDIADIIREDLV